MARSHAPEPGSAYATLAALAPDLPAGLAQAELLRALVTATGAVEARIWRAFPAGFSAQLSWPPELDAVPDVTSLATLDAQPGVSTSARIQDGDVTRGAVSIGIQAEAGRSTPDRAASAESRRWVQDTANCVLLLWCREELATTLEHQIRHTDRLAGELADAPRRLSTVRELERRRVATEIITLSTGRLGQLRRQVVQLGADLGSGRPPPVSASSRLRDLLDELIEDFRVMVRGIYPLVLQSRGPRAALAEVAAGLARPARISGTVPARIDPELGAALYHLTAAALQTLARTERPDPLEVQLSHAAGLLEVLLTGRARISTASLRAALTVDIDRLSAIGGGVEVSVEDDDVTLRAWVPDRLEPAATAPRSASASLPARVRTVALGLAARYGDHPGAVQARGLVSRLDGPVRLAVRGFPESGDRTAWLAALGRRLPDLALFSAADAHDGTPDVILQPAAERPDRRIDAFPNPAATNNKQRLDTAPKPATPNNNQRIDVILTGSGTLIRSAPWRDLPDLLATEVLARADLLRARSVLAALIDLLRRVPPGGTSSGRLGYELEELQAGAFELAELEALAQLRTGTLDLTRAQLRVAERLLGVSGPAAHERLGLPASTPPDDLFRAITQQMEPWRRLAETSTAGRRERYACAVIVRNCEALLTAITL